MKITIQDARTSVTLQQRDFRVTISGARGPAGPQGDPGEGGEWGTIVGDITEQTDLYNALQAKVPYTGATQDVNLGEYGAQLGNLEFDNTPTNVPTTAGSVYWNDTDGTLNIVLKGGQTISRIGETQHIRALNNTGAQIARGKVVYVVGAQGQRLTIGLADADTEILSKDTIGFTAEAIADGAEGFVIVQGVINNVSTTGMTDGATVYLSQTAGGYTTTAPTDPAHMVVLGFIVNGGSGGAGSIYVKVDNGYELEELHGVADAAKVTPVGADALLLRDSADNNLWKRLTWTNTLAGVKSHMDTFKSVAGGYASLDGSGKVPASELPSYVDDVVEVANYAALPGTGETGKIYVTLDTNKCYRWTGSVYVEVSAGGGVDTLTTTGTSGAATLVGSTLNIPQYQGVLTNPVTGTGTAGQVAYFSGTSAVTGSSSLVWDAVNGRLGVGTSSPTEKLHVASGNATINGNIYFGNASHYLATDNSTYAMLSSNRNLQLARSGTPALTIDSSLNVVIGTTTPSARLHVRGSGATSSTTALLVQNSTPSELFKVLDNGAWNFNGDGIVKGSGSTSATFAFTVQNSDGNNILRLRNDFSALFTLTGSSLTITGTANFASLSANQAFVFTSNAGAAARILKNFNNTDPLTSTSGLYANLQSQVTFAPTSGTSTYNDIYIISTINQTGGANGITRGLYVNPTLTAAADWRSIETSNNTGYAIYTAGTANSYFGGNVGIGTASPGQRLDIRGNSIIAGSTPVNPIGGTLEIYNNSANSILTIHEDAGTHESRIAFRTGGNDTVFRHTALRLLIDTETISSFSSISDSGFAIGIGDNPASARLHVRGSGATSATTALLVQNSTPSELFKVTDNGAWNFNGDGVVKGSGNTSGTTALTLQNSDSTNLITFRNDGTQRFGTQTILLSSTGNGSSPSLFGRGFLLQTSIGTASGVGEFTITGNINSTSGNNWTFKSSTSIIPTSGTSTYNGVDLSPTINQTGGANGITRGLYVNPTLTAAADWRSIETSNNTGYAAYFAGSADLFLGNGTDIQIGTTTGTKIGTATNQLIGLWNATPIAQPTTAVAAATRVGGAGNTVTDTDTFDGYTIAQLVKALRNMGALA